MESFVTYNCEHILQKYLVVFLTMHLPVGNTNDYKYLIVSIIPE